ncbi:MAG TPA: hypothetical protein VLG37_04560 [Candidatus Saccharimonadales bacterium]|nr:hypothetical protein [Candidatus Saccharimonadales bacterium]
MRYLAGFLLTLGLLILLIVLIFNHGGGNKVPVTQKPLVSYANTDTITRLTIDGAIVAPENHRQVQIEVGRNATTFEILQGYDGNVINKQIYPMTLSAYTNFLFALQHSGYTLGTTESKLKDERGYCPDGRRYIYEIEDAAGKKIEHFWSTSCGGLATFKGKSSLVLDLFHAQVPNYDQLTFGLNL